MEFFDKIGEKISSASKDVAKKTKEIADITKINIQINNEEDIIKDLYSKVGKLYYEAHKDSPEEIMVTLCASITESLNKIELNKKQIQTIKGISRCPKCGAENEDSALFCGYCGYKMINVGEVSKVPETQETQKAEEVSEVRSEVKTEARCPNCGEIINGTESFCSNCGQKLH